jgi:hypothetical protein
MAAVSSTSSRCTFCPCGPVWCVTSCMPRIFGVQLGVFARLGHLHAAAFAAASGMNLRLHHHAACALGKQLARHLDRLFQRVGHLAFGHGNAVLGQNFFCLILVNFQVGTAQSAVASPPLFEGFGAGPSESGASEAVTAVSQILSCGPKAPQTGARPRIFSECAARCGPASYHIGIWPR